MPGKFLFQQITLKQAKISITISKEDSAINLLLQESGGAVLVQKKFVSI
jgi:hypothetical protein